MKKLLLLILLINVVFVTNICADDIEVYDSGWVSIDQDELKSFLHSLGGDTDNYEIEIQQKDNDGQLINNIAQGGGNFGAANDFGAYFTQLSNSTIKVKRLENDIFSDNVRVIIRKNRDSNIQDNTTNTTANMNNILLHDNSIASNADNITSNDTDIVTNVLNISNNASNIFTNNLNITTNRNLIDNNSRRLDNHEGRIEDLEETQVNLVPEIQFIRGKNYTVSVYTKYDVRHSKVSEVGLRATIGLGESWAQKKLERLEVKLNKIEYLLCNTIEKEEPIKTKIIEAENGCSIMIEKTDTVKLLKKF